MRINKQKIKKILNHSLTLKVVFLLLKLIKLESLSIYLSKKLGVYPDVVNIQIPTDQNQLLKMKLCSGKDQVSAIHYLYGWGAFEPPLPDFLLKLSEKSVTFLDVGANTGFYSFLIAKHNKNIDVFSFEPEKEIYTILKENKKLNELGENVKLFSFGLANENGNLNFYIPDDSHGLIETSASFNPSFKKAHKKKITVPVQKLDDFWKKNFNNKSIDLMKIDVEGFEHEVLLGSINVIKKYNPLIFIEVLSSSNFTILNQIIKEINYSSILLNDQLTISPTLFHAEDSPNQLICPSFSVPETVQALQVIIQRKKD